MLLRDLQRRREVALQLAAVVRKTLAQQALLLELIAQRFEIFEISQRMAAQTAEFAGEARLEQAAFRIVQEHADIHVLAGDQVRRVLQELKFVAMHHGV